MKIDSIGVELKMGNRIVFRRKDTKADWGVERRGVFIFVHADEDEGGGKIK